MNIIQGNVISINTKLAIVVARFNKFINDNLLEGSIDTLKRIGQVKDENITVIWIPGAYELPLIVHKLALSKKYDAILALATIIRGNTEHFKFVSDACNLGLLNVSINAVLPISCGILITENIEQAIERAGSKIGNKGAEAALSVLEMINILKIIESSK